jgi:hypothetical protein
VTVSTDELMELLQVIETMITLGDVECAVVTVRDWMKAHRGEARVIFEMKKNKKLLSEIDPQISSIMRIVLHRGYDYSEDFLMSRTHVSKLLYEFPSFFNHCPIIRSLHSEHMSRLCASISVGNIGWLISKLDHNDLPGEWTDVGKDVAIKFMNIVVWTREQHLTKMAFIYACYGDFRMAIRTLFALMEHLEHVDPDELYFYTGLPYVPGPEDEL